MPRVPTPSLRWSPNGFEGRAEALAEEAPLAIEIAYPRGGQSVVRLIGITMRTPGHDEELALGFLRAEGLIGGLEELAGGGALAQNCRGERIATWRVSLAGEPREDPGRATRALITSSACGVCGRATLAGLPGAAPEFSLESPRSSERWAPETIESLPKALHRAQQDFAATGGSHAAGLAEPEGRLILAREDVGRHNAVDKVIGAALARRVSLPALGLVLSGRASFELIQKAAAAGIGLVAAVGAPSSLAVQLAHYAGITLVGFAREGRFNLYTHVGRLTAELAPSDVGVAFSGVEAAPSTPFLPGTKAAASEVT